MATLQELLDQRQALADQIAALDAQITALTTGVPVGWTLELGDGEEPGSVQLNGQSPDGNNVSIVVHKKPNGMELTYIKNQDNGGRGKAVDSSALKAAVGIYETKYSVVL